MHLLGIDTKHSNAFNIIPHFYIALGKTFYFSLSWLNFEVIIKHISTEKEIKRINISTPSILINQDLNSPYLFTLDIYVFGLFYRKSFFLSNGEKPRSIDNTNGFVHISWFEQFNNDLSKDLIEGLEMFIKQVKDKIDNNGNNL